MKGAASKSAPGEGVPAPGETIDPALVRKYSVPGPRYTSYPTAVQFRDDIDAEALLEDARGREGETARDLSLYFHLPFCESRCWFCGCTTVISRERNLADSYIDYLEKEIALLLARLGAGRRVVQMHWGGGTPTFLSPAQIRRLGSVIHRHFTFSDDAEVAVEVDPRRLVRDHVRALRDIGANRASLGVQDHNPEVQRLVNRIQPRELTVRTLDWLRDDGFVSINLDLIYGLPGQTADSVLATLDDILELQPDRLAVFSYAHVPWIKPAQKILERRSRLPGPEEKLAMLCRIVPALTTAGYVNIGMDHFARPDDELATAQRDGTLQRNFQGYSTRGGADICGFGMSAISQTPRNYRQNEKEIDRYYAAIDEGRPPLARGYTLSDEDRIRREVILRLMCDIRLDYGDVGRTLGIDLPDRFRRELESLDDLEKDGLLQRSGDGLRVTPLGRLLVRNIAMRFDAYLGESAGRFSRTV